MAEQGTADIGSNAQVGTDPISGNPFLKEKTNGNKVELLSDGTFKAESGIVLTSPDGTDYLVTVDDTGSLVTNPQ